MMIDLTLVDDPILTASVAAVCADIVMLQFIFVRLSWQRPKIS